MLPYRHTQIGWVTLIALAVPALAALGIKDLVAEEAGPSVVWLLPGFIGLMAVLMVLFGSLTVDVDSERIRIRFGPGFISKRWFLSHVESAEVIRTRIWHGWGIHLTPQGWLYNVSGFDAVRISLASGKSKLVGTNEPDQLVGALRAAGVPDSGDQNK